MENTAMHRCAAAVLAAAGVACAPLAVAAGAATSPDSGPAPTAPAETVTLDRCHSAPLESDRYATFSAQMTATARTRQMWVRFKLLERQAPGLSLHPTTAPGLGVWQKSAVGIGLFRYSQEVTNLPAPGSYRASVSFRWYDAHGRVVRRAHLLTPMCTMPDEGPQRP